MKMMRTEVKLYTEHRRYGSRGVKPTRKRSAAAAKARAIFSNNLTTSVKQSESEALNNEVEPNNSEYQHEVVEEINLVHKGPKGYGKHNGNVHVQTLYTELFTPENRPDSYCTFLDNLTARFEAMPSWDFQKAKYEYTSKKEAILDRYHNEYGEILSESATTNLVEELGKNGFEYTIHQITILLVSDEPFEGARQTETDYRRELKTKRVYSKGKVLLPLVKRNELIACSKIEHEKVTTHTVGTSGVISVNPITHRKTFTIDFGQLTDRVFDSDCY